MNYDQLADFAKAAGFTAWAPLDTTTLNPRQEVRDMCAVNACGKYGKCWSCPPACGSLPECIEKLSGYTHGILVQSVGDVEDSFDFEAMMEIEAEHKARFLKMNRMLREAGEKPLALGAGCCTKCKVCSYPDAPCRFPEEAVSSMEAYGIVVLETCKANGLQYYYGADKMAYAGCFLL